MRRLILTIIATLALKMVSHGAELSMKTKCQLLQHPAFHSGRIWWTREGRKIPSLTFQMRNVFGSSQIQSQFDLAAAARGWDQMSISSDGQSFWIQQICVDQLIMPLRPTDSFQSYTQPLFYGMRASTGPWCRHLHTPGPVTTNAKRIGPVAAYPIHYEVQCIEQEIRDTMRLLVRMMVDQIRWVYQCLFIKTHEEGKVLQMLQSQSYAFEPKESLCNEGNMFDSIFWIPSLKKDDVYPPTICPFEGGFQITSIKSLNQLKSTCDYQTYATLESECVHGDGMEWYFDDPNCNLFHFDQATRLKCLVSWKAAGLSFVLLRQKQNDDEYTVYSMIYTEMPDLLNNAAKSYQDSKPIWIGMGLGLVARLTDAVTRQSNGTPAQHAFLQRTLERDPSLMTSRQEESLNYEVQLRRAFGICDDERTTCNRGCDFDARNRMFCYRTCASDDKKCDIPQWDFCQFGSNYQGNWDLVDLRFASKGRRILTEKRHISVVKIAGNHVRFIASHNTSQLNATLQCVREVSETIRDWFVVRTVKEHNGCRPRDLCLELFQTEARSNFVEKNTNTLQFRLSQSHKQGTDVKTLCDFRSATQYGNVQQPKLLVKQLHKTNGLRYSQQPIKCGLYQIRLTGTMVINTALIHSTNHAQVPYYQQTLATTTNSMNNPWIHQLSRHPQKVDTYANSAIPMDIGYPLHTVTRSTFTRTVPDAPRICSVQLSDFNRSFGITGEFDNVLRVETACSNPYASRLFNTSHECLSVYNLEHVPHKHSKHKMIITYNHATGEHYCWIFEDASKRNEKIYIVYVYHTPQCRYTQTLSGDIIANEELALIRMNLTPGTCLNCHRTWNDQQITSEEFSQQTHAGDKSAAKGSIREMVMDSSKQRPTMRSLRIGTQSSKKNEVPFTAAANVHVSVRQTIIFTCILLYAVLITSIP